MSIDDLKEAARGKRPRLDLDQPPMVSNAQAAAIDSAQMPRDPRDQAWLLWRKRLEGWQPIEVVRGWRAAGSLKDLRTFTDAGALETIYAHLMGDPANFGWTGGSGNWPWVACAAKGDCEWAEDAAAADLERGIGRLELGSPEYSPDRLLAQAYLLHLMADHGSNLRELVRRQWLIHSLAMVPAVPHRIHIYGHDGVEHLGGDGEPPATSKWYSGWTCAMPQTRVNADSMVNGLLSYLVTKAMGAPCTYKRKADPSPDSPYWPIYALALAAKDHFPTGTFLAPRGISSLTDESELAGLRTAFRWSLYRTDAGTACWIGWRGESGIEPGPTTFKPTSLFNRVDNDGEQHIALPQRWAKETGGKGSAAMTEAGNQVICRGADTSYLMDLPLGKPALWLEFGPQGARRVA